MASVSARIKHGKTTHKGVQIFLEEPVEVLRAQLYTLTMVPPERQKITFRGKIIKDDIDLSKIGLKDGSVLMVLGTADELAAPETPVHIIDDMALDAGKVMEAAGNPGGLVNLGNTCYMNSTLQCLRSVPELKQALMEYTGSMSQHDPTGNLVVALREVMNTLDSTQQAIPPFVFIQLFRQVFPQFGEQNERGGYAQQDAEEAWTQLSRSLGEKVNFNGRNVTDLLFGIEMESTLTCAETDAEPVQNTHEKILHLSCHIDANTNHMHEGVRESLLGSMEKHCNTLGRNAVFSKVSKIKRLPKYLVVQFVRFFWKAGSEGEGRKSKILRVVHFPERFDISDMCSDRLKARINKKKEAWLAAEDARLGITREDGATADVVMEDKVAEEEPVDEEFDNTTGMYELQGVLTHMGRSADGGHYISWVRDQEKTDIFNVYDDDTITSVPSTDIKKLEGGADWHIAYMLLYKSRDFK